MSSKPKAAPPDLPFELSDWPVPFDADGPAGFSFTSARPPRDLPFELSDWPVPVDESAGTLALAPPDLGVPELSDWPVPFEPTPPQDSLI